MHKARIFVHRNAVLLHRLPSLPSHGAPYCGGQPLRATTGRPYTPGRSSGPGEIKTLFAVSPLHTPGRGFPGISERAWTDDRLKGIDPPPFEYNGKTYTYYEATQVQRRMETQMRDWKRQLAGLEGAEKVTGTDYENLSIKLARYRMQYKDFSNAAGLRYQLERAQVYKFGHRWATESVWTGIRKHREWLESIGAENSPLNTLNRYYAAKFANGRDYLMLTGYNRAVKKGEITPLTGYALFEKTADECRMALQGIVTNEGVELVDIGEHAVGRVIGNPALSPKKKLPLREGVPIEKAIETVQNPRHVSEHYFVDGDERVMYTGLDNRVVVSITDKIIVTIILGVK
ncbi:MAG: phage minor capsid protein [Clostridiales Family XIII bacterium]|jgi:hypothetical protein|nr:phage minor capsid protein [Clostridiales Family XIII bacterium]